MNAQFSAYKNICLIALICLGQFAFATNYYVSTTGDNGTGVPDNSGQPFASIQYVISTYDLSLDGAVKDSIILAAGTYSENNITLDADDEDFIIIGQGTGNTIVDGTSTDRVFEFVNAANDNVKFELFTIKDGDVTGDGGGIYMTDLAVTGIVIDSVKFTSCDASSEGGALYVSDEGSVTITNCVFNSNGSTTTTNGGAIHFAASASGNPAVTLSGCVFSSNTARSGGAICFADPGAGAGTTYTVTNCTFTSNSASGGTTEQGGAITVEDKQALTVTGCAFTSNTCDSDDNDTGGGAIMINCTEGETYSITNSTFTSNSAGTTTNASGGAISVYAQNNGTIADLTISSCTFESNFANGTNSHGGAVNLESEDFTTAYTLLKCNNGTVFTANYATSLTGFGGGIYSDEGNRLRIDSVTFSKCKAARGGGIWSDGDSLDIDNCFFYADSADNNTATYYGGAGGGVYLLDNKLEINNTTFAMCFAGGSGNTQADGGAIHIEDEAGVANIYDCEFYGNECDDNGSVIDFEGSGSLLMQNCLIYENTADDRAAVFVDGEGTLVNCTITDNVTNNSRQTCAGGVESWDHFFDPLTVKNCIVYNNTTYDFREGDGSRGTINVTYSCYENYSGGGSISNSTTSAPDFEDSGNDNYDLNSGSPCENTANNADAPAADITGAARANPPDMGCYELGNGPASCPDTITWGGAASTDWANDKNWMTKRVPCGNNVIIPETALDPIIGSGTVGDVNTMIIETNGALTLTGTGYFDFSGDLINNGTLTDNNANVRTIASGTTKTLSGTGTFVGFDMNIGQNASYTLTDNWSLDSVRIGIGLGSGSLTVTTGDTLTVAGTFYTGHDAVVTLSGTASMILNGTSWLAHESASIFTLNDGMVDMNGSWLAMTGSNGTINLNNGSFYTAAGTVQNSGTMTTGGTSRFIIDGSTNTAIQDGDGGMFFDTLIVNKAASADTITTANDSLNVADDYIHYEGTMSPGDGDFNVTGLTTIHDGEFINTTGQTFFLNNVTMNNDAKIDVQSTSANDYIAIAGHLDINGTAGIEFTNSGTTNVLLQGTKNIDVASTALNASQTAQITIAEGGDRTLNDSWVIEDLWVMGSSGTMEVTTADTLTIKDSVHVASGGILTAVGNADIHIDSSLYFAGTVTMNTGDLYVGKDFRNNGGTFNENTSTLHFDGDVSGQIVCSSGSETIYEVINNKASVTDIVSTDDAITVTNIFTNTQGTYHINGGTLDIGDTLTITNGELWLQSGTLRADDATVDMDGGVLDVDAGTVDFDNDASGNFDFDISGGKVEIAGGAVTVGDDILLSGGEVEIDGGTLTINSEEATTNEGFINTGGTLDINGGTVASANEYVQSSGTLEMGAGTFNIGTSADGLFSITGGTYNLTAGTIDVQNHNASANEINIATGATVGTVSGGLIKLSAQGGASEINVHTDKKVYNLEVDVDGQISTIQDDLDIDNNITITSGQLVAGSTAMNVGGTWTNNSGDGTAGFSAGTGSVTMDGGSAQTITGTKMTTFCDLTLNNSNGITIDTTTTLTDDLTFTDGFINTSYEDILIMDNAAADNAQDFVSYSSSKYIKGPVRIVDYAASDAAYTDVLEVPVGDGNKYSPVRIIPNSTNSTTWEVRYADTAATDRSSARCVSNFTRISPVEEWHIRRLSGTADARIRLTWTANSLVDDQANMNDLVLLNYNKPSTCWSAISVDTTTYTREWAPKWIQTEFDVTSFGDFTFGSIEGFQLIPASCQTTLTWDGSESDSWKDPANWDLNTAPCGNDIIIPDVTTDPILDSIATVGDLTVNNGGFLTLAGAFSMTITGNVDINGTGNITQTGTNQVTMLGSSKTIDAASTSTISTLELTIGNTISNTSDISIEDLTVQSGGTFTLSSGNTVTLSDRLDNDGTITFSGTADSLLVGDSLDNDGTITLGTNSVLDVDGVLDNAAANTLNITNGKLHTAGNFTTAGTFTTTGSTVVFDGDSSVIFAVTAGTQTFNHVLVNKLAATDTIFSDDDFTVQNYTGTQGVLKLTTADLDIQATSLISDGGIWMTNGTLTADDANFDMDGGELHIDAGAVDMDDGATGVDFDMDGGTVRADGGTWTIGNDLLIDAGKFIIDGATININDENAVGVNAVRLNAGEIQLDSGVVNIGNAAVELLDMNGGTFDMNGGTMNIRTGFDMAAGTFEMSDGELNLGVAQDGVFKIAGGTYNLTGGFIDIEGYQTNGLGDHEVTIGAGATVDSVTGGAIRMNDNAAAMNLDIAAGKTIYSLVIATTNRTVTSENSLDIDGSVTITSGLFDVNNNNITVAGDWTNNYLHGTAGFDPGTARVTFDGKNTQTVSGTKTSEFYDVTVNKVSNNIDSLVVDTTVNVSNSLTLTSGMVITTWKDSLIVNHASGSTNRISGGNDSTYIDGPVQVLNFAAGGGAFADTLKVPVGDGSYYSPVYVIPSGNTVTTWGIRYADTSATTFASSKCVNNFKHVSRKDMFHVRRSGGGEDAKLRFYWNSNSEILEAANMNDLFIAHFDKPSGSCWELTSLNEGDFTRNTTNDFIETDFAVTEYSPFAFASKDGFQPLPIELYGFEVELNQQENRVDINWTTATELNNDYFVIEKTQEGKEFEEVIEINSQGESLTRQFYETADYEPYNGVSYYRLKTVGLNGEISYSDLELIINEVSGVELEVLRNEFVLRSYNELSNAYKVQIYDIAGREILNRSISTNQYVSVNYLQYGVYFIHVEIGNDRLIEKVVFGE